LLFESLTAPFTSDYLKDILDRLSKAILLAAAGNYAPPRLVRHALQDLIRLESLLLCMAGIAYGWCSAIYQNCERFTDWENLLLLCLEIGLRHIDSRDPNTYTRLTHTEHHQGLVNVVFKSQNSESIVDLLCALTFNGDFSGPENTLVDSCIGHLVDLHRLVPFSPWLQDQILYFMEDLRHKEFGDAEVKKLIELLGLFNVKANYLRGVRVHRWISFLLNVIQSPGGAQRLPDWHWKLLAELLGPEILPPKFRGTGALRIAESLIGAEEWGKLEYWVITVWPSPWFLGNTQEGLEIAAEVGLQFTPAMVLDKLFEQQPDATEKLEQRREEWRQRELPDLGEAPQGP
jgi:hypothetical protein